MSGAFALVLVLAGAWSFYGNVLNPHAEGVPMEGMVMSEGAPGSPSESLGSTAAAGSEGGASARTISNDEMVPPTLGGLPLADLAKGDEARAQVEQLHGKSLGAGLEAAWTATYGSVSGSGMADATLWISRAARAEDARTLFERMTDRISEGNSPFEGLRPMRWDDVEGYALDGMGQKHYYFLVGSDLYWIAVDPAVAEAVVAELLGNARSAAAAG
ncbi:MAG: hypothetical protein KKA32_02055 [Actinobacteria bacterium]|nr:hypothetical protein [Actinomycetota bacterium]